MRKLERNGKIGLILANGGYGWYTLHKDIDWLFSPELVYLIESKEYTSTTNIGRINLVIEKLVKLGYQRDEDIDAFCGQTYVSGKNVAGASSLRIQWVLKDSLVKVILMPEGGEIILLNDDNKWIKV